MKGFSKLYRAGRVTRYHTADIKPQTLAAHSWGVALIVAMVYPKPHSVPTNLLLAALTHDLAESKTGDIPATAKWENAWLAQVLDESEHKFNLLHGIHYELTTKEGEILKWADTFELCLYCLHQVNTGNEYAGEVLANGLDHIRKKPFPTTESKELYDSIFGD